MSEGFPRVERPRYNEGLIRLYFRDPITDFEELEGFLPCTDDLTEYLKEEGLETLEIVLPLGTYCVEVPEEKLELLRAELFNQGYTVLGLAKGQPIRLGNPKPDYFCAYEPGEPDQIVNLGS